MAAKCLRRNVVNWSLLLILLRANYKAISGVAREVDSNERHLNRIARGEVNEPKFMVGVRLLDLYHSHVGDMARIRL